MASVVADTHVIIWFLEDPTQLTSAAETAAETPGEGVVISTISIVEMQYLIEKGRISRNVLTQLRIESTKPDPIFNIVPLDWAIADNLDMIPRMIVPDMPDRIIAATAHTYNMPLITADTAIHGCGIQIIW